MRRRIGQRAAGTIVAVLVILIALMGGSFYYASRVSPAYVPDEALPPGWYLDNTEQESARLGLDQQIRYTYVKGSGLPAALSVFTFHNVMPQSSEDVVRTTMRALMLSLGKDQNMSITGNNSGPAQRRDSFYIELEGERSLGRFNKEYLSIYGEFWKDGYGTYVMCIGFAKTGERSLMSSSTDAGSYKEIRDVLIPAIRQ